MPGTLYGPGVSSGTSSLWDAIAVLSVQVQRALEGTQPAPASITDLEVATNAAIQQAKIAGLIAALTALAAADTTEATARAAADTTEATTRAGAVSTLTANLAAEATTRGAADTTEATARATADALLIPLTQKAAANGVATLGADSKIPGAQLPALAINDVFPVANQAAMLALTAQRGDVAIRTDLANSSFILSADDATVLGNWVALGSVTADASALVKGIVQLAGDLGGTAASPTVPGLAAKQDTIPANTYVDRTTEQDILVRKKFRGASRGPGAGDYLTEIGGDWPYIATNSSVIINGSIGEPIPSVIAGEGNYMLGISSDVGDYPVIIVRAQSGPVLRFYDAGPNLVYEVIAAGMVYARPGVSDGGGHLPAYAFIANRHTGMDMTGADVIVFYSAASEKARITATGMTVTGDFVTTQKIQTGDAGIDLNNKWLFYLPGGATSYLRDLGNARMQVEFQGGASSATALTTFNSGVAVAGALTVTGDIPSLGGVGAQREISLTATPKTVVGAWTAQQGGYMFMQYNSSGAQNDSASFGFAVPAGGTYTIEVIAESGGDSAIADITIDGGASIGTADLYGAGAPLRRTIPGVVLTPGTHTLKLTGSAKNGSSSGYLMRLHRAMLTRTA